MERVNVFFEYMECHEKIYLIAHLYTPFYASRTCGMESIPIIH
jgi:hypothetical protein